MSLALPDFPWDSLAPYAERAREHRGGMIDLSVGSPVDATPRIIADALREAVDAHAYPATAGTPALREAIVAWYARRRGVTGLSADAVLPTIGSKELIAWLPLMLGLGADDTVVFPATAYPTYAIGAALAGSGALASDDPDQWPASTRLIWLNSPGNPDGRVLGVSELRRAVARARRLGAVIVNDECYAELNWADDRPTVCILDDAVTDGDRSGILSVYSLSKQSNLAGYRAAFLAGCRRVVAEVLAVRKHAGLMPPAPVQHAMTAALGDDEHVAVQRERYRLRRELLLPAVQEAGFRVEHSSAGLYLWITRDEDCWQSVAAFAELGILVTPGAFYGAPGQQFVRVALTAGDAAVADAASRLRSNRGGSVR